MLCVRGLLPYTVLNEFMRWTRKKLGIGKIAVMKIGILLVSFNIVEGKEEVLRDGIFHFDNKPLIAKGWNSDLDFSVDELFSVPI